MEAIGTDFTYSIEGVTDGEVDAAEVPLVILISVN